MLKKAEHHPVSRPVAPARLARKPLLKAETKRGKKIRMLVSVPDTEEADNQEAVPAIGSREGSSHTEIQYRLLELGSDMGFGLWVASNDRGKTHNGKQLGAMSGVVKELPTQFNPATNRTIELIDVLWLRGNSIAAAFEVECTTSVYSGLLRMSDLLALQPNLNISLYIVAPDERRDKVAQEVLRPTFMLRQRPIAEACGFIPFSELVEKSEGAKKLGLTSSLKEDFLEQLAEYFTEQD